VFSVKKRPVQPETLVANARRKTSQPDRVFPRVIIAFLRLFRRAKCKIRYHNAARIAPSLSAVIALSQWVIFGLIQERRTELDCDDWDFFAERAADERSWARRLQGPDLLVHSDTSPLAR
jgi:hypothetical protein